MSDAPDRLKLAPYDFNDGGPDWAWSLDVSDIAPDEHLYIRAALVPQWQPIETAPKDGTKLLLWWGGGIEMGCWSTCGHVGWTCDLEDAGYVPAGDPTHWMLIPEPPMEPGRA